MPFFLYLFAFIYKYNSIITFFFVWACMMCLCKNHWPTRRFPTFFLIAQKSRLMYILLTQKNYFVRNFILYKTPTAVYSDPTCLDKRTGSDSLFTWLRCSMEFDSLPVFSSSGTILSTFFLPRRWILTPAVTSTFPFKPNRGDQMFSSMSIKSVTARLQTESWRLRAPSLGLVRTEHSYWEKGIFQSISV